MLDDPAAITAESPAPPGVRMYGGGRLAEQRRYYEAAAEREPDNAEPLLMLGVTCLQLSDYEAAAQVLRGAVALDPGQVGAQANLAAALMGLARYDAVVEACDAVLALDPSLQAAHANRGLALMSLGRPADALASLDAALALNPAVADLHYQRGKALHGLGRLPEAGVSFDAALALYPDYFDAQVARGETLAQLDALAPALASYEAAIALRPELAYLHSARGALLTGLSRFEAALEACDTALALGPDDAGAHINRAAALNGLGRIDEALAESERGLELGPELVEAHSNRAVCLHQLCRLDEAMASHELAVALTPDFAEGLLNRSYTRLKLGDLPGGFEDHRARWRARRLGMARPAVDCPEWAGEDLAGRRLLVFSEQGFGDSLQFVRHVAELSRRGAAVTVRTQAPLVRLFQRAFPDASFVAELPEDAAFDFQIAMMCLPRVLGITLETIPGETPYLAVDPAKAAAWGSRLAAYPGPKVGLVWAGGRREGLAGVVDRRRSLALAQLAPLADVAGVTFVSLQLGEPAAQAVGPPRGMALVDVTAELADFDDTAALVEALDLVIAVDTAVAHLAGALAKPVWMLSRFDGCWRWLVGREDSPWYPTLRLFQQTEPQSWAPAIAKMAGALADWRAARGGA